MIFHAKEIRRSKTKAAAFVLTATEWAIGATSAMGLAMLFPAIVEFLPFPLTLGSPEAELGFFGFIGGSMGRELFRLVQRKFFGGWDGVERRQERRGDD